tara:strand:+ start:202 stop:762 length:561 start_codon:yes stop_codon:yes gene_type:complete
MDYSILNDQEVNDLYDMFKHLVYVLNKYAVEWVATDGTLLGAVRHGGFIPWDDDIDIAIKKSSFFLLKHLEHILTKAHKYTLVKVGKYCKLKYNELWIDIFLLDADYSFPQKHFKNLSFIGDELKPIKKAMFYDIEINIPNKAEEYLDRILPGWNTTAIIYNHKVKKKISLDLTDELKLPYPLLMN